MRDWKWDELEEHAEALCDFLENETSLGMRGGQDCLHRVRQAIRYFGNGERAAELGRLERARIGCAQARMLEGEADELVFARWREWHLFFGVNRLKLRDLMVATFVPHVAKLEREVKALRRWIDQQLERGPGLGAEVDLTGCYREIDEEAVR